MSEDNGVVLPPPAPAAEPASTDSGNGQESLANDFLKNVSPEDRPYVEKYVKDWDSGVTQRFQKIHQEYDPYKNLGADPDTLKQALTVMELLNTEPEKVYEILKSDFEQGNTVELPKKIPPEFEGLPEGFIEKFQSQEQMLENMAKLLLTSRQEQQQKSEDQALAAEMDRLKKQHGDFDEEYVMTKMYHGASGDDAVKAFQTLQQNIINSQSKPKPQPPSMFGGGPLPADRTNVVDMDKKDVQSLVADMLKRAAEG